MKKGQKMSNASKEKMRQAKLLRPVRYWKGKKISPEHNRKMQAGKLKYPPSQLGKKRSKDQKKKISDTLKDKYKKGELVSPLRKMGLMGLKGEKAMNWRGGATVKNQRARGHFDYKIWMVSVHKKYNFTCLKCKKRGGKLHAHHIQNFSQFPELRFDINNGISLCPSCHKEFHKMFGVTNNNYQQIIEYLTI